jgi:hypothetical protein
LDLPELTRTVPGFFQQYLEGAEPQEILPPMEGVSGGAWRFRLGRVLVVTYIPPPVDPTHTQLRINLGLAIDVPYRSEVAEYVNRLNHSELTFGRMFLIGDVPFLEGTYGGLCAVVMQEIVYGESLSADFAPSLQNLVNMAATLTGQGDRLAGDLLQRFEGRAFTDDEAFILHNH